MQDSIKVASVYDLALDPVAMGEDGLEYARTRDAGLVKLRVDRKPTWFHLQRIDANAFTQYVQAGATEHERRRRAFQLSVTMVENLVSTKTDDHGKPTVFTALNPSGQQQTVSGATIRHLTDSEMALIPPAFVEDVGDFAYARSFLAPGSEAFYQPPRSSLTLWAARLSAAARAAMRKAASESASSQPAATTPTQPSPSSEAPEAAD